MRFHPPRDCTSGFDLRKSSLKVSGSLHDPFEGFPGPAGNGVRVAISCFFIEVSRNARECFPKRYDIPEKPSFNLFDCHPIQDIET